MTSPIYELAGQQEDPFAEEVLAVLFSDQPVRRNLRPRDSRRHWQWWARSSRGDTSRVWLSVDQPITDTTTTEIAQRAESALAVFVPRFATSISVTATQVRIDSVRLDVTIVRPNEEDLEIGVVLTQGGS